MAILQHMRTVKTWFKKHYKDILIDGLIVCVIFGFILGGGLFVWISTLKIPDLSSFEQRRIEQSTKIYDRTGEVLLYDLHQDVRRTIVPFEKISYNIKNASVAIEDDQFYNHHGVDPKAILRALISNIISGDSGGQGGSTITQQVIKNSVLEKEKSLTRKVKEAILSIKLERVLSKDEILSHYLNESPYGGTIYGVEEASQAFFAKPASDLTLPEAAYIAALPQAPTYLSPYGSHRAALDARQKLVLSESISVISNATFLSNTCRSDTSGSSSTVPEVSSIRKIVLCSAFFPSFANTLYAPTCSNSFTSPPPSTRVSPKRSGSLSVVIPMSPASLIASLIPVK